MPHIPTKEDWHRLHDVWVQQPAEEAARAAELWQRVAFVHEDGRRCYRCQLKHTERQAHGEILRTCDLLENAKQHHPYDCPGVSDEY